MAVEGVAPRILIVGTKIETSGQRHDLGPLPSGKEPVGWASQLCRRKASCLCHDSSAV